MKPENVYQRLDDIKEDLMAVEDSCWSCLLEEYRGWMMKEDGWIEAGDGR
jgi:hypothetical protein